MGAPPPDATVGGDDFNPAQLLFSDGVGAGTPFPLEPNQACEAFSGYFFQGLRFLIMGSGDDNKMEAGASKRSDFKETFYEEPGSIHLIERARGTEPDPVAYKGLEEALLSKRSFYLTCIALEEEFGGGASFLGQRQKFKDVPFLLLYAGSALLFFMVNLVILVKSSQSASLVGHASSSIYRAIQGSLIGVSLTIVVSILVGLSWLASICLLTKPLLWFTFLSVPAASILMFLLMLTRGFIGFSYQGQGSDPSNQLRQSYLSDRFERCVLDLKLLSLIPLSVAVVHSLVVHRYHASIRQAVEVIRLSALILKSNVDILGASLFCLAIHVLFSCVWLVSFDRLFLLGHVDTIRGKTTWVHDDTLYWLVPFYVGFFWWTSNIINNAERESNYVSGYNPAKVALRRSLTTSLGSLSLAGLLMAVVKLLNFARATHERFLKGPSPGLLPFCIRLVVSPVIFAARFVEGLSFFTVTYVGISGKPFFTSARIASTILHRNFFQCLLTNYLIRATIYAAIITTSTVSMFAFFSYSAGSLGTSHPLAVGILGLSIPFFILRFMMNILVYTMDAVYLCYGIDVDQKTTHFAPAHRVLSQSG
ncbi:hypothetical protein L0F63_004138 [Massospora cicadina]|nr:hypothetical protein L0F63_004138 [Massospora cicadina]